MRFMVFVKNGPEAEGGKLPDKEGFEAMGRFNLEMANAGMVLAADGLQPTSKGARISFTAGKPVVTDGPFTGSKDLVAGFWIIQAKSKEDAIAWMSRAPFEECQLEIRQVFEPGDLPAELTNAERRGKLDELIDRANVERNSA